MIDEAVEAKALVRKPGVQAIEDGSTDLRQRLVEEASLSDAAPGGLLAEQRRRRAVRPQCAARVPLIRKLPQELCPMDQQPICRLG
jgi:hypothetical protein